MDPNENRTPSSAEEEKARLREHYRQQDSSLTASPAEPGRASFSSSPSGTTNTVPMTEEELHASPVHSPYLPSPSQLSPATTTPASDSLQVLRSLTPPPYSGPSTPSQKPPPSPAAQSLLSQPRRHAGLPPLDYRLYNPPLFTLSSDRTTIRSSAPYLSSNASALISLIRQHATVPPKPQIHITGKRASSSSSRPDFAIKLNLMHLLIPSDSRQKLDYLRCVSQEELALRGGSKPTLEPHLINVEEWARRYVDDKASQKSFTLERVVANLDVNWLEGQIRALVAEMKYPGTVTVSFPVTHNKVVVSNPEKSKFLASVAGLFSGKKKYEVVKAVWPFASGRSGEEGRRVVTMSEEDWWREWRDTVRFAISTKRHGWVTNEDKLEVIMEGEGSAVNIDWGPEPSAHTSSWD
ncbi:hypothetical protein QBC35DRAFT_9233 [Podospora australis]|uniref:Uncharacterized protein n=1 Tax=Podospora australis TaxID=1536484 RepID=A0AAN6X9R0_9PEZI|nr:hypothetical protein QBC35DRAFT_9233 [Podospora australis]